MMIDQQAFLAFFREAAPYIHQYRGKIFVIGLSGHAFESDSFSGIAQDIALLSSLGVQVVLVHGGRPQIEAALKQRGLPSVVNADERVTDKASLIEIKKVFGAMRFDIEATLSMGLPNTPMAGASIRTISGNFITARPYGVLDGVDMLYSGKVRKIDGGMITQHLQEGCIVVVSPVGYSLSGETFNLKMEEVASKMAIQLKAEKLLYLIKDKGVLDQKGVLLSTLSAKGAQALLDDGGVTNEDGCRTLPFAIEAVSSGVTRAQILSATEDGAILNEVFTRTGTGTSIAQEAFVKIREATLTDIPAMMSIIQPLEEKGVLLKRSREHIENKVQSFAVLENDTLVYACVALEVYDDSKMAELSCLAVAPFARTEGYGQLLLEYVEEKAKSCGVKTLFILTTQTAHWFVERGFKEASLGALPKEKQKHYNHERKSKIFTKELS